MERGQFGGTGEVSETTSETPSRGDPTKCGTKMKFSEADSEKIMGVGTVARSAISRTAAGLVSED